MSVSVIVPGTSLVVGLVLGLIHFLHNFPDDHSHGVWINHVLSARLLSAKVAVALTLALEVSGYETVHSEPHFVEFSFVILDVFGHYVPIIVALVDQLGA